jgi:hypothetical protein
MNITLKDHYYEIIKIISKHFNFNHIILHSLFSIIQSNDTPKLLFHLDMNSLVN